MGENRPEWRGAALLKGTLVWGLWGIAHIYFLIGGRTRVMSR